MDLEQELVRQGYSLIAGLDEVGRGCLAGPVVAAAVVLRRDRIPDGINDSKKLTEKKREELDVKIRASAVAYAIGVGEVEEIDRINILQASKQAMVRAVQNLSPRPDFLLLDGNFLIECELPQRPCIGGDQLSLSIAAASIIAKVFRDNLMKKMDDLFPGYAFAKHKGYGSKEHREAIQSKGICSLHRKSFSWTPV